ncbi:ferredoxin [Geodermatophilus sp. SYSU D00696]
MAYTVSVDKDTCLSSGRCVADAPAAFRFDDDELAEPVEPQPRADDDLLLAVARACPSAAIAVQDPAGRPVDLS